MDMKLYYIGVASFVLEIDGVLKIGCDPVLNPAGTGYNFILFKSRRTTPPVYDESVLHDVNVWFITHGHADHIDALGVSKIAVMTTVITQKSAKRFLASKRLKTLFTVDWHDTKELKIGDYTLHVQVIPAYHASNLIMRLLVGRVNGYYLTITRGNDRATIYITSDTVYDPTVVQALQGKPIDLLIANLGEVRAGHFGGPLTMSAPMLQQMVHEISPKMVIPIHYDGFSHFQTKRDDLIREGFTLIPQGKWVDLTNRNER